jgi:hypothetical protein
MRHQMPDSCWGRWRQQQQQAKTSSSSSQRAVHHPPAEELLKKLAVGVTGHKNEGGEKTQKSGVWYTGSQLAAACICFAFG